MNIPAPIARSWPISEGEVSRWITSQRPPRAQVDPLKPYGFFLEQERSASGRIVSSACILLTNKECPWRCLMCDLWKHTLAGPTPAGAIPQQIKYALDQLGAWPEQVKLYNSGSFFDQAAIPPADYQPIAETIRFAGNVVVESHPRLVGSRTLQLRDLLPSTSLEVAMGLETVHPVVLPRLNKRFTLEDFASAAEFLSRNGISLRAFILVQPPFVFEPDAVHWAVESAKFAFECGASVVSLIPTRPGNGALDALMKSGDFKPPSLRTLEQAFEAVLGLSRGRVFADTWDLEQFSRCSNCFSQRKTRLDQMNLTQMAAHPINCAAC